MTVHYEIFGVPDPYEIQEVDTKPIVLGSLTVDENEMLNKLLDTGIQPKKCNKQLSASTGSVRDLSRVKTELMDKPAQQTPPHLLQR